MKMEGGVARLSTCHLRWVVRVQIIQISICNHGRSCILKYFILKNILKKLFLISVH
jgi:hypothetical protein